MSREYIRLIDVHKSFGPKHILEGINLTIEQGDRIGIVGHNGSGKTTLLNTISEQNQDIGEVIYSPGLRIAFLTQIRDILDELTPNKDGVIDINMQDDVIRGMTIIKNGEITYPPPKIKVSVTSKKQEKKPNEPGEVKEKRFSILPGLIAISSIFLVGAFAPESFMNHFIVFVLSCFIGYMVIWNVTASLHTPLMSVTNAVSSIIIIGALSQISSPNLFSIILSGFAVFIASINIVGGFAVTKRMLGMFKK